MKELGGRDHSEYRQPADDGERLVSHILRGMGSSANANPNLLRALGKTVAAAHPGVTCDELVEIARNSPGLVRAPAGLNGEQRLLLEVALKTPRTDTPAARPIASHRLSDYEIDPAHLVLNADRVSVGYANPVAEFPAYFQRLVPTDTPGVSMVEYDVGTVADQKSDVMGLESREGCPARLDVARNGQPFLTEIWQHSVDMFEHYWRLTVPSRPPVDLAALPQPISASHSFSDLKLENLGPGIAVRLLPSATGQVSVELSDDDLLDSLKLTADGDTLSIAGQASGNGVATIRFPLRPNVKAREVSNLEIEYGRALDVAVPRGGKFAAHTDEPDTTVSVASDADVFLFGDKVAEAKISAELDARVAVLTADSTSPGQSAPDSIRPVRLRGSSNRQLRDLPVATKTLIGSNIDLIGRHWDPALPLGGSVFKTLAHMASSDHSGRPAGLPRRRNGPRSGSGLVPETGRKKLRAA